MSKAKKKSPVQLIHRESISMTNSGRVQPIDDMTAYSLDVRGASMSAMSHSLENEMTLMDEIRFEASQKQGSSVSKPQNKAMSEWMILNEERRLDLKRFIAKCFHEKECKLFVPKPDQQNVQTVGKLSCHCGEILLNHRALNSEFAGIHQDSKEDAIYRITPPELHHFITKLDSKPPRDYPSDLPWKNDSDHVHSGQSMSFGKIYFGLDDMAGRKPSKYVRISDEDNIHDVMKLLKDYWNIGEPDPPQLVISVTGGAKNFKLSGKMRDNFNNGLIKAAKTTSAWLITSGFNMGVMKSVGQAVHQGQSFVFLANKTAHKLRCIGIAPWGYIKDRHQLTGFDSHGKFGAHYRTKNVIEHKQPVPLNPDHTHFIFVDDGSRNVYGKYISEFRSKFERVIQHEHRVPVVLIIVEGGTETLEHAAVALKYNTPVVICAGTGRAADLLAYACKHMVPHTETGKLQMNEHHQNALLRKIRKAYFNKPSLSPKELEKCESYLKICIECAYQTEKMMICDMNKHEDLDLAILKVLLKSNTSSKQQLELALNWNRVDIAQEEIFKEDEVWSTENLYEVLTFAIHQDKVDFVKLLLAQGVVMKDFLTVKTLRKLYESIPDGNIFRRLNERKRRESSLTLKAVGYFLKQFLDRFEEENYFLMESKLMKKDKSLTLEEIDERKFENPYQQLMIWSIFNLRQQLALFCWEMGHEPIVSAVAATQIYGCLAAYVPKYESSIKEDMLKYKNEFEDKATNVLNECYKDNRDTAMVLVKEESQGWGRLTALQIASAASDKKFISSVACQNYIGNIWKKGIVSSWKLVLLTAMCPFFLPKIEISNFITLDTGPLTIPKKMKIFFSATITKFTYHALMYSIFIMLMSYMVLVDCREEMSYTEVICITWILAFVTDDIYTFIRFPSPTRKRKFKDFFGTLKIFDTVNLVLAVVAFGLRWSHFEETKVIYCINTVIFYLRLIRLYTANSRLGPKIYMFVRMLEELMMFLLVLLIFLLAYGVASQGLMYKRRDSSWSVLKDVLEYPYYQLHGEIFLDEIQDDSACYAQANGDISKEANCRTSHWMVPILLSGYLLLGNVLLLNILIAIFNNVFEGVQKNSIEIWKYQMYYLVLEYNARTTLVPPFSIFLHIYKILRQIKKRVCSAKKQTQAKGHTKLNEFLKLFEKEKMLNYLRREKLSELNSTDLRFSKIQKRLDELTKLIEDEIIAGQHHQIAPMGTLEKAQSFRGVTTGIEDMYFMMHGECSLEPPPLDEPPKEQKQEPAPILPAKQETQEIQEKLPEKKKVQVTFNTESDTDKRNTEKSEYENIPGELEDSTEKKKKKKKKKDKKIKKHIYDIVDSDILLPPNIPINNLDKETNINKTEKTAPPQGLPPKPVVSPPADSENSIKQMSVKPAEHSIQKNQQYLHHILNNASDDSDEEKPVKHSTSGQATVERRTLPQLRRMQWYENKVDLSDEENLHQTLRKRPHQLGQLRRHPTRGQNTKPGFYNDSSSDY